MKKTFLLMALVFTGCATPSRISTTVAPGFDLCSERQFSFVAPTDYTRQKWLSQADHRKLLEDILRKHLTAAGLTEAPGAPLAVAYSVNAQDYSPRDVSAGGIVMASDFRLGTVAVRIDSAATGQALWSAKDDQVLGTQLSSALKTLDQDLARAFKSFPRCRVP